ncbi:EscE/YscE/SsaE family type III secretion system needle protein co-chaperone [Paraburkholderia bonniea]|uniref:EscE/YscE/SsaE family type III secretion system needle protein co-chaperone n=1 Tax=Paraburkholderia bonniea TaxID=2152891 RepID=UPI0012911860|nr:EscE/YscE/SsaE family type III secretion system needle protein co-chaperone [Paraburkholderia bonniea]WJF89324.1 EscE/YscE/SsaE family type III secretion system needle protein co-chaperone [Paraburkholderia bonniea]WJF92640.1 EscE/YscE/SsaE family type III secretion system needle protein co-chaperone [Paraburkholderia bonniea]
MNSKLPHTSFQPPPEAMTELETELKGPHGEQRAQALLAQLKTLTERIDQELRRKSTPERFKELTTIKQALSASSTVIETFSRQPQ